MEVTVIAPPPTFGPSDHATLAAVAQVPGSKILDCTRIAAVPMNLCQIVTAGWAAPHGAVPRLAVVLQIDTWSLARMFAPKAIAAVRAHGTDLRLFYARQLAADHVHRWITEGVEPPHELGATLDDLDRLWQGSPVAANVVDAVLEIARTDATPMRASYLATLSSVALKFADAPRARTIAHEALDAARGRDDAIAQRARAAAQATLDRAGG